MPVNNAENTIILSVFQWMMILRIFQWMILRVYQLMNNERVQVDFYCQTLKNFIIKTLSLFSVITLLFYKSSQIFSQSTAINEE